MPSETTDPGQGAGGGFRFLSVGECMVEMAPATGADEYRMGFAGDTFNTAWHLRQLRPDVRAGFFSRIGQDGVSDAMSDMMASAGIDISRVTRSADRSVGLYLITLHNGERTFTYWRDTSAARQLADDPGALARDFAETDIVYFSGITVAILDAAGRDRLLSAVANARAGGKVIAFDPNLRPRLWQDADEMRTAIIAAAAISDIVLPSYDDEAVHFGDRDTEATARRYTEAGARTVVVKNGAGRVFFVDHGAAGHVQPPEVAPVVDTTAAGDSFNAGFFASLDTPASLEDRILCASAVAGQVIGQKGALVPVDPAGVRGLVST